MPTEPALGGLYRLFAWLSPGFPTGAFSYSHGLEAEAAAGRVRDRETLEAWITTLIRHGSGRVDADLLREAYLGEDVNERGLAYRATAELALESSAQGTAFAATVRAAWSAEAPHPSPLPAHGERETRQQSLAPRSPGQARGGGGRGLREAREGEGQTTAETCYPVAVGAAAARADVPLETALVLYLQAFAANLMAAGLRLGVIGQTAGQRILAALEPVIGEAAAAAVARDPADFGAAAFAADLASMAHETQYTRLFRS